MMNRRTVILFALVGALCVGHTAFKAAKIFANRTWDAHDETGQFWSEFAFHYRFAKFFAEHPVRDWAALAQDRDVQYPATVNDWAEFTVAMEVPVGVLYRWLEPAMPFHVWVVWYDCAVSSLALLGLFLLARALWRNDWAGLAAAFLYAALYPSHGRTVKNLFLREDFALPIIVFALWATVAMWRSEHRRWQVIAALLWLAALASWHLTQFVLAVGVVATVLVYLGRGETPRRPWFVALLLVGGVVVPVLRAKQFYLSLPMVALVALAVAVWINGGRRKALLVFGATLAGLVTVSWWARTSYGEYAHVYQLFLAKLRFAGVKPADPVLLPWEARVLWEGAFETATAKNFWQYLGLALPAFVLAAWCRERRRDVALEAMIVFGALLVPLAWMVVRYFTFLAPAVAVLAAGLAAQPWPWRAALAAATLWHWTQLDWQPLPRQQPTPQEYRPVVTWLNLHTSPRAVVLATIAESPVFWAHTGRPIVLHSKFENEAIRNRYRELLTAIYVGEEEFYAFACRYGADYFIYDAGFLHESRESRRYKADRLGPLPADCAARLMAEQPEKLRWFRLEFVHGRFAVFRVIQRARG
jgi:hypothetical protein